jgi:S1-C subfamily serine protease
VFLAGGKVPNGVGLALDGCTAEDVTEPPLPVRFLDPAADYGLTLDAGKDGMTVSKVAEKSAFADHLKAGDVIASVSGVNTATAPAFRRELRRGIIEGAMLLDVTRGKEKLELLVPVPDVPPSPKKDKKDPKATSLEKK